MLSITSSSERRPVGRKVTSDLVADRLPDGRWGRTWLATVLAVLLLLGAWEGFLRSRGFQPSIDNVTTAGGAETWAVARSLVPLRSSRAFIVLGASRAEHGIVPEVLARTTDTPHPIFLTMAGASFRPLLHNIAVDPRVRNPVLCALNPEMFFDASRSSEKRPLEWIAQWRATSTAHLTEEWLHEQLAGHLALRHGDLKPGRVLEALAAGHFPTPEFFVVRPDRSVRADYTRFRRFLFAPFDTLDEWKAYIAQVFRTEFTSPNAEQLQRIIEETREDVRRIEERGGRVFFLRMPSGGETLRVEDERFPRERTWDVFAREIGTPCLYFQDNPGLDRPCGDNSHLNYADAVPFTEALGDLLAPLLRDRSATVPQPATEKTPPPRPD